mmetsp:Transcript_22804/g.58384  ORF Transcript_22804/g.58384 Transcript_22804/m.58384 type:complete len:177 (+) Transcript_22804:183-713(+)
MWHRTTSLYRTRPDQRSELGCHSIRNCVPVRLAFGCRLGLPREKTRIQHLVETVKVGVLHIAALAMEEAQNGRRCGKRFRTAVLQIIAGLGEHVAHRVRALARADVDAAWLVCEGEGVLSCDGSLALEPPPHIRHSRRRWPEGVSQRRIQGRVAVCGTQRDDCAANTHAPTEPSAK